MRIRLHFCLVQSGAFASLTRSSATMSPGWNDEGVCRLHLAGCCPYNLFTAAHHWRIGAKGKCVEKCDKVHDAALRREFKESGDERVGKYERELLNFLDKLVRECDKEIEAAKERVNKSDQSVDFLPNIRRAKERLQEVEEALQSHTAQAEAAGEAGNVDLAQESMDEVEKLKREKATLEESLQQDEERYKERFAAQRVCDVCGSVTNPNDATTEERHLNGNRHNGWHELRSVLHELLQKHGKPSRSRSSSRARSRSRSRSRSPQRKSTRDRP